MGEALDKGTYGEQGAGFYLGARGFYFVDGPSGTQKGIGHAANAPGEDGVAFNPGTQELIYYDNKAFAGEENVGTKATAIDPARNLARNLDKMISKVERMSDLPDQSVILDKLKATRASIAGGNCAPPPGVKIAVTNFGGKSRGITAPLAARGVQFIDMMSEAPKRPPAENYVDRDTIVDMAARMPMLNEDHMRRLEKAQALAAAVEMLENAYEGDALADAIDDATADCAKGIMAGQSRGMGSLMVYTIANIPMGVLVHLQLSDTNRVEGKTEREAYLKWQRQPILAHGWPPHVAITRMFRWIGPMAH